MRLSQWPPIWPPNSGAGQPSKARPGPLPVAESDRSTSQIALSPESTGPRELRRRLPLHQVGPQWRWKRLSSGGHPQCRSCAPGRGSRDPGNNPKLQGPRRNISSADVRLLRQARPISPRRDQKAKQNRGFSDVSENFRGPRCRTPLHDTPSGGPVRGAYPP